MERYKKKNKGNPQRTPRSRSTMFPSLRGEMDWWKYRSRSPLSFLSKYARIMGGMEKRGQALKVNNGGERSPIHAQPKEKEGVFIPSSKIVTVGAT
jgi:hypothetical protein